MSLSLNKHDPRLLYNPSPSAPIGWYKITPSDDYNVGDRVAVWLPESAEKLAVERGYLPKDIPIIKTIKAGPGDRYCIENQTLTLAQNQRYAILSFDSQGRELPVVGGGCRSLEAQEFLVLSDRVRTSFDSRYFGAVTESDIIGVADFLGESEVYSSWNIPEEGGARGPGAQGKIKGDGTNPHLSLCLHINFYGPKKNATVLTGSPNCNHHYRLGWYHFTIDHDVSLRWLR